ncbi:MAG: helix-turn-helix domain-containing protein [Deltaproteobacteria bacterium]|nr:helix-turn-helix domain-containing protein [Deltaproteobacteria bacterium]
MPDTPNPITSPGQDTAAISHMASKLRTYELAAMLGVPPATIYSWVRRKQIPHVRLGKSLVLFDRDEIDRWLESRRVRAE